MGLRLGEGRSSLELGSKASLVIKWLSKPGAVVHHVGNDLAGTGFDPWPYSSNSYFSTMAIDISAPSKAAVVLEANTLK